ncbi:MAG: hypothetical protein J7647_32575 [Cyanobacteria bacterium SBLK]|nr:hypothetical protein [Cyanobacteria bacterium SBLK]
MILSRRQTHFFAFSALAILLPLCFIAGIALRPSYISTSTPAPVELLARAGFAVTPSVETIASTDLSEGNITLNVETGFDDRDRLILTVQPAAPILRPDVLVYWEDIGSTPEELSEEAFLLGSLSGVSLRQFFLPDAMRDREGYLILYSQVQQELIVAFSLPADLLKA